MEIKKCSFCDKEVEHYGTKFIKPTKELICCEECSESLILLILDTVEKTDLRKFKDNTIDKQVKKQFLIGKVEKLFYIREYTKARLFEMDMERSFEDLSKKYTDLLQEIEESKSREKSGRPKTQYPDNWEEVYDSWKQRKIPATKAMELVGMKKNVFYRSIKRYEEENKKATP